MPLHLLQALAIGALAALCALASLAGGHQARKVAGVDCARVEAAVGHVSPWERDACR
jgi:hypothetical protein